MVARFLPGLRAPTYFTVGHSRVPFWEFLLFDGLAALVSAPLWVCLGFWFGDDIERAARAGSQFGDYILAGVLSWSPAGRPCLAARRREKRAAAAAEPARPTGR